MRHLFTKTFILSALPFIAIAGELSPELCSSVEGVKRFISAPASAQDLNTCKATFHTHNNSEDPLMSIIKEDQVLSTKEIWGLYTVSGKEDEGRARLRKIAETFIECGDLDAAEDVYELIGDHESAQQLRNYKN